MIKNYGLNSEHKLVEVEEFRDFSFVFQSSRGEIGVISKKFDFPFDYLGGILDDYENARFESDKNGNTLLLLQFAASVENGEVQTFPFALVTTAADKVIFSLNHEVHLNDEVVQRSYNPKKFKHEIAHQIISVMTKDFANYLANFKKRRAVIEKSISKSTQNDQLLEMIRMQASLVYIQEALDNNLQVLKKYIDVLKEQGDDGFAESVFDLYIDTEQAKKEARMQARLIENLRDLFSNIVANNLNIVMKIMTSATFVLGIPAVVFGFYGINVPIPGQSFSWIVWIIIGMTLIVCGVVSWVLRKKDMM
ncbi:MAG TPA: magnesium transporter CorA family protein [Lactovum miscens]|uniref:magnesium transporter CorA family protein n=1 Tax=Lactovum miscens TaxID=190387 RepID=UPI002ED78430